MFTPFSNAIFEVTFTSIKSHVPKIAEHSYQTILIDFNEISKFYLPFLILL